MDYLRSDEYACLFPLTAVPAYGLFPLTAVPAYGLFPLTHGLSPLSGYVSARPCDCDADMAIVPTFHCLIS